MTDENEEETAPPSISQTLTNMHNALSSSLHGGPHSSSSSSDAFSVLPPTPLQCWYIKPETPLTWLELCAYGRVKVTTTVYGYRKVSKLTSRVLDRLPLTMPVHEFETWACWIDIPPSIQRAYFEWAAKQAPPVRPAGEEEEDEQEREEGECAELGCAGRSRDEQKSTSSRSSKKRIKLEAGTAAAAAAVAKSAKAAGNGKGGDKVIYERPIHAGLHGLNHCMIGLMPMYLLCDGADDLRCDCPSIYEASYDQRTPRAHRVLMYEKIPSAGPAFMRESSRILHRVLSHARQVIENCPCTGAQGCPGCVQSSRCSELNEVTDKAAALWMATTMEEWAREYPIPG
jgi:ATP-dependent helicase YprA (DUF1998 family)